MKFQDGRLWLGRRAYEGESALFTCRGRTARHVKGQPVGGGCGTVRDAENVENGGNDWTEGFCGAK